MNSLLNITDSHSLEKNPNYQKDWEDYRILKRNFHVAQFSIVAFGIAVIMGIFSTAFDSIFYLLAIAGVTLLPMYYVTNKLQNWRCPQCNELFHRRDNKTWLLAKKCMNCKLPKYDGSIFKK